MNLANLIDFWKEYLREYTIALGLVLLFYALSRIFPGYSPLSALFNRQNRGRLR